MNKDKHPEEFLSLSKKRLDLENVLRKESLFLEETANALSTIGMDKLATELYISSKAIRDAVKLSSNISNKELDLRVKEANRSTSAILRACMEVE